MDTTKKRFDYFKGSLATKRETTVADIRSHIAFLQGQLNDAVARLDEGKTPNSCGVVQSQGSTIDSLVTRLNTINEQEDLLKNLEI